MLLVEDGAAGSKGTSNWEDGRGGRGRCTEGTEEGGTGGPGTWSLGVASQTLFAFLVSGPGGHLGSFAKPMFFRTFLQKKTSVFCSGLGHVKLNRLEEPFSRPHFPLPL